MGGAAIHPADCARNLGVMTDCDTSMQKQVNSQCRNVGLLLLPVNSVTVSAYYCLRYINRIRTYLDNHACASLIRALVPFRLDYAKSLSVD